MPPYQFDPARFDVAAFLRDHWQKKPLLIRNPWQAWENPLEADELAGLACEEDVEARLISRAREAWKMEHGPIPETRFSKLDKDTWTLLVQAVDHQVPQVAALVAPFRFVPNWRIDDVMVSYASDGGGVGPHFDNYDVFLIQGLGRRRWRIGQHCDDKTELLPHDDLRLLAHFEPTDEWVLEPGDMLYVPPGFAHDGVAVGDECMTYSIGFRAPARSELVAHWCDRVLETLGDDDRYTDPDLQAQPNPGEISDEAITRLQQMVAETLLNRPAFARWFGEYTSTPKYPAVDWRPEEEIYAEGMRSALESGAVLLRNPAARFAFLREAEGDTVLFVNGRTIECPGGLAQLAERLCAEDRLEFDTADALSDDACALLAELVSEGSLAFEDED